MDLYEVEIIAEMEDVKDLIEEREDKGEEEMESPGKGEEENEDPVSIELVELKARALRYKDVSNFATGHIHQYGPG